MTGAGDDALFPRMRKLRGWQVLHDPAAFDVSTCMSWLNATGPGLSAPWGSVSLPGSFGMSAASAAPPSIAPNTTSPTLFAQVMVSSPLGEEVLPSELRPLLALELRTDAEDRRAAVLEDSPELRAHPGGQRLRRAVQEAGGGVVGDELPQVVRQPRRLDLEEPALAVRLGQGLGARARRLVDGDDGPLDGREHRDAAVAGRDLEGRLTLCDAGADGRERDARRADELLREVVHADGDDAVRLD